MDEILYTSLNQIAERLGVGKRTVVKWIKTDKLPAFKDCENGPWRANETALSEWINLFRKRHQKNGCQEEILIQS